LQPLAAGAVLNEVAVIVACVLGSPSSRNKEQHAMLNSLLILVAIIGALALLAALAFVFFAWDWLHHH
jgi:hypothetical protein